MQSGTQAPFWHDAPLNPQSLADEHGFTHAPVLDPVGRKHVAAAPHVVLLVQYFEHTPDDAPGAFVHVSVGSDTQSLDEVQGLPKIDVVVDGWQ